MSASAPVIAFTTTCKNRLSHLYKTLPQNIADNADYPNARFIVLDYGSDDELSYSCPCAGDPKLSVYSYRSSDQFRMSFAKNMAHRCGILEGADILVNVDADNFTGLGFASYIARQFAEQPHSFLWAGILKGLGKRYRGCGGRIALDVNAFLKSGGYDERYDTWGPDDKNLTARLVRMGYDPVQIDRQYLQSIPHSDGVRFREYPHVMVSGGEDEIEAQSVESSIANYGRVGCGTVYRNFSSTPIELGPVPTRIFGIGLHKTATNSLCKALTVLGLDCIHWRSAKKARQIWRNPGVLDQHYAAVDLPIPLMYKDLDRRYPGSKFILTMREEGKWLESVMNHWSYDRNPYRASWDTDCFTHHIHTKLYGRHDADFDAIAMLNRYRQHNAEVKEHFADRPNDLCVMYMDGEYGDGWRKLCGFLGVRVPRSPYPFEFQTSKETT